MPTSHSDRGNLFCIFRIIRQEVSQQLKNLQVSGMPNQDSFFLTWHTWCGAGMKNPEYISDKPRCLNHWSKPTHDLKDKYPSLPSKEYNDEKMEASLIALHTSPKEDSL